MRPDRLVYRSFAEALAVLLLPVLLLAVPLLVGTALVRADRAWAAGSAEAGERLARQWCGGCHAVDSAARASDAAAPLETIAQRHRSNQEWLRAWLAAPHPPMPDFTLSRGEIDDIVTYLAGLAAAR